MSEESKPQAGRSYQLAVTLLYGHVPGVDRLGRNKILVTTPRLAFFLGTSSKRLRRHAQQLQEWGIVKNLTLNHGTMLVELAAPVGMDAP